MHRVLELEVEQTNNDSACSNEITITTINMKRKFRRLYLHLTQRPWAEAYLHAKYHLDPSSRLAIINMGRKCGALPPFGEGSGVPI